MLSRLYANVHFAMQSQTCIVTTTDVHFAMCCHECMQTYTLRCSRRHVLSRLKTYILRRVITTTCRRALCDAAADLRRHDCRRCASAVVTTHGCDCITKCTSACSRDNYTSQNARVIARCNCHDCMQMCI